MNRAFLVIKTLSLALLVILSMVSFSSTAFAASTGIFKGACSGTNASQAAVCSNEVTNDPLTGPNGVLGKVTKDVALFAGATAVIIMMVGGFMYILSNGDSGKVSTAKDTILYAAVGLVVIALAQTLIVFVIDRI